MAIFPFEERWQAEPKVGNDDGEFTAEEIKGTGETYLYHAIHILADGKARLAKDGERVDGSFVSFDGASGDVMLVYSFRGKGLKFRNGTTSAINLGTKIVGAERSGATPGEGYVKNFTSAPTTEYASDLSGDYAAADANTEIDEAVAAALTATGVAIHEFQKARGIVRGPKGAAHSTVAEQSPADVIVEFGFD